MCEIFTVAFLGVLGFFCYYVSEGPQEFLGDLVTGLERPWKCVCVHMYTKIIMFYIKYLMCPKIHYL